MPLRELVGDLVSRHLGELGTRVVLDDPERIHYGSEDPVTGHVEVTFKPHRKGKDLESSGLSGSLRADVVMRGRIKTEATDYASKKQLFVATSTVHDGPINLGELSAVRLPFTLCFPEHPDQANTNDHSGASGEPLPASFTSTLTGFDHRSKVNVITANTTVSYTLDAQLEMPGVDVKISRPEEKTQIRYEKAKIEKPPPYQLASNRTQVFLQTPELLPEAQRRNSLMDRAKAAWSGTKPTFAFDVECSDVPQAICLGQPTTIEMKVSTNTEDTNIPSIPEVTLTRFNAQVLARDDLILDKKGKRTGLVVSAQMVQSLHCEAVPNGPFSKATENKKTVIIPPIHDLPSSYRYEEVSRKYRLRLEMQLTAAGEMRQIHQDFPIDIHPPLVDGGSTFESWTNGDRRGSLASEGDGLPGYRQAAAEGPPPPHSGEAWIGRAV